MRLIKKYTFLSLFISLILYWGSEREVYAVSFIFSQTISNPTPVAGDNFGYSISSSGTQLLIGTPGFEPVLSNLNNVGRAYLYDSNGALVKTFNNPSQTSGNQFGSSVGFSVKSNVPTFAVGEPHNESKGADSGTINLFDLNATLIRSIDNPDLPAVAVGDLFGNSISVIGTNILIGAPQNDPGASNAGSAYLFNSDGAILKTFNNPQATQEGQFGFSVALQEGGNFLIGAPGNSSGAGAAYLFSPTGALLKTFENPTPDAGDQFGFSVATIEGNIVIGAPNDDTGASNAGSAYLFSSTTGLPLQTYNNPAAGIDDRFGYSVDGLGNNVFIGAPFDDPGGVIDLGTAYAFNSSGNLLSTINNPSPAANDQFGFSIGIEEFGGVIAIGAPGDNPGAAAGAGAVHLFSPDSNTYAGGPIAFAGGPTALGGGSVVFNNVSIEGTTNTALATPSNTIAQNGWHFVHFNPPIFYKITTTATFTGKKTLTFHVDPSKIPMGLGTADLRGIHVFSNGSFRIIKPNSFDDDDDTFDFEDEDEDDDLGEGFGVVVNPEPATLLLLGLALLGLLPLRKK